jgi:hypothetical protein
MSDILQQVFNFYFRGGWLWLALVTLLLLIFVVIDNHRRQRQALAWIVLLMGCLFVFMPSLFYSLSNGRALSQATREIFYAGVLGAIGAVLGLLGYLVSFQWRIEPLGRAGYPLEAVRLNREDTMGNDPITEITAQIFPSPQPAVNIKGAPAQQAFSSVRPPTFFSSGPVAPEKVEFAPGWLQDRAGQQYRLHKGITQVGREEDQHVRLPELTVSRRHALIRYEQYGRGDAFLLQAIGKSETALNGVILGKDAKQLYDGDRVRLGTVELTFFTQAGR